MAKNLYSFNLVLSLTIYGAIRRGELVSNDGPCLGWRPDGADAFEWMSYSEVIKRAHNIGVGLNKLGVNGGAKQTRTFVGIHSDNRPEWILVEHACYCYNMVVVPIYDTLGDEAVDHIVDEIKAECIVVDKLEKLDRYAYMKEKEKGANLRLIIVMETIVTPNSDKSDKADETKRLLGLAKSAGLEVHSLADVEKTGKTDRAAPAEVPPQPGDISTIYYTSGTTGVPKGVVITHGNLLACVQAVIEHLGSDHAPSPSDSILSFLPLAHTLERAVEVCMLHQGASIGYYSGSLKKLAEDYRILKPTIAAAVPRVLNRVYEQALGAARKTVIGMPLIMAGVWFKTALMSIGIITRCTPFDWLIFRKIQTGFGGRLRLVVVGSAPLDGPVMRFMRSALGCNVLEGYGQTETSGGISLAKPGDWRTEHVGSLLSCNEIKLIDVPDSGVFVAKNGQGEVLVRGANVFEKYYKLDEKTKETVEPNGWMHTGDIGRWTRFGTLQIVDRCKNIFKLSQGEYIATDKIEDVYEKHRLVKQIFLYGDSKKSQLVALIVPHESKLKEFATTSGGSLTDMCDNDEVRKAVVEELTKHAKKMGLKSFEQVKNVALMTEEFSEKDGMLTPTQKVKRKAVQEKYQKVLDNLYAELGEGGGSSGKVKSQPAKKKPGEDSKAKQT